MSAETKQEVRAIKASIIQVPYEAHLTLSSLASSAVPTTYCIVPTPEGDLCVAKIKRGYEGEEPEILMWWVCGRRNGAVDILTPRGEVVASIADDKVEIMGLRADPYDYVATIDASPVRLVRLVRVAQVVIAVRRVLRWVHSLYPPIIL